MAVGDVVSDISNTNTVMDFQPAAGIEVLITSFGLDVVNTEPSMYNGTLDSRMISGGTSVKRADLLNAKMFLTNTNYLRMPALGAGNSSAYSGIQIK